jgi:hypothetical protein
MKVVDIRRSNFDLQLTLGLSETYVNTPVNLSTHCTFNEVHKHDLQLHDV